MREAETLDSSTYPRAQALLDEAKQVGLVDERTTAKSYEGMIDILRRIASDTRLRDQVVMGDGKDLVGSLRAEHQGLRTALERVNGEIRSRAPSRRRPSRCAAMRTIRIDKAH